VIDKPGKGAFYATALQDILHNLGIQQLVVTGVTTEVCVHTTVREANDRGFNCLVLSDCVGSYFPSFHETGLQMIQAQGGIFGSVATSLDVLPALEQSRSSSPLQSGTLHLQSKRIRTLNSDSRRPTIAADGIAEWKDGRFASKNCKVTRRFCKFSTSRKNVLILVCP